MIVETSLCVWDALNNAVERDRSISDIVMNSKAPSQAWIVLTSMIEDEHSNHARENAENEVESFDMIARIKGLARAVEYHGEDVVEKENLPSISEWSSLLDALRSQGICLEIQFFTYRIIKGRSQPGGAIQAAERGGRICPDRWL